MTPITPAKELIAQLTLDDMLELNKHLVSSIKRARNVQARRLRSTISYGDKVSFEDNSGVTVHGEVVKVMRKYAKVNVPGGPFGQQWRVPLIHLTQG